MDADSAARQTLAVMLVPISIPMDASSAVRQNRVAVMAPFSIPTGASNVASLRGGVAMVPRLWILQVNCAVLRRITRDDIIHPGLLTINQSENRMKRKCIFI